MKNKKGFTELPFYFIPSLVLLVITLLIFGILFFIIGIEKSPNLVIRSEAYEDTSKLNNLLKININLLNEQMSLAEAISQTNGDPSLKPNLEEEIKALLERLPKPPAKQAFWNLKIEINHQEFLTLGQKTVFAKEYHIQKVNIPLENKAVAKITLSLNCYGCTREELEDV